MNASQGIDVEAEDDAQRLRGLGYRQELARRLGGFSNFAISFSIICILAGGVSSFHLGLCSVGGASIGLGWPLVALFSLAVAATMGQLASAFPTAGGLYHWAAILGGRGWGWATAWFNLAGLVTVLAAINVGTYRTGATALGLAVGGDAWSAHLAQLLVVVAITASQAAINHLGIGFTAKLTDFSGYWILIVSLLLAGFLLAHAPTMEVSRLVAFENFGGTAGGGVWPATGSLAMLFALGMLLPAYTITGFDASAHASEETVGASAAVPRGIVRSVLISGLAGWALLSAVVLAAPSLSEAAAQGEGAFPWILHRVFPTWLASAFAAGIVVSQYLCGLATVTSASRMAFAFARDGGLPFSRSVRWVCPRRQTPPVAIWAISTASVLFTVYTPVYSTITAVCTILLYLSYVLPSILGARAYGKTWTAMGPWSLGGWYRPLSWLSALGCVGLIAIGMQPPNERSAWVVGGLAIGLAILWVATERKRFPGPPILRARAAPAESEAAPAATP